MFLVHCSYRGGGGTFNGVFHAWCCNERQCKNILADALLGHTKSIYETGFVMAAHWLITSKCLKSVGGFSPSFEHGGEDNNYAERVRFQGYKVGIVPSSLAIHDSETLNQDESIKGNYINLVQQISCPQGVNWKQIIRTMLTTVHFVFIYKSLTPLKNIARFFKHKSEYDRNRVLSQQGAAFLS